MRMQDGAADGTDSIVADEPIDAIVQLSFTVMALLTRIAAEHEMSLTQLRVLGILRDRRPRMAELAGFLGLERSTMSGLISRAERRGLLERVRSSEDARATEVVMTPRGHEVADRIHREVTAVLGPFTDRLSARELASIGRSLSRMLGTTGTSTG